MNESPGTTREIEIKLDLGSFTNYLKLIGYLGQIDGEARHQNAFFDTEDGRLAGEGWVLRVRAENTRGLVTVKSRGTEIGVAHVRDEIEAEISRSQALECLGLRSDVMSLPVVPIQFLRQSFGDDLQVAEMAKFDNHRQIKSMNIGDLFLRLEIDRTEFTDGSVDYELEVELPDTAHVETATDALRRLFASLAIPFERQPDSKFARARKRLGL